MKVSSQLIAAHKEFLKEDCGAALFEAFVSANNDKSILLHKKIGYEFDAASKDVLENTSISKEVTLRMVKPAIIDVPVHRYK